MTKVYKCSREKCAHVWTGRMEKPPKKCARCKNPSVVEMKLVYA